MAHATAMREQVMEEKGLNEAGPQVAVLNFQDLPLEKLQALADGRAALPEKVVEAEVEKPVEYWWAGTHMQRSVRSSWIDVVSLRAVAKWDHYVRKRRVRS